MLATVAEGIGRDVEDAHDARAVELQLVFSAAPNFGIACHEDPFETDKLVLLYPAHSFYVARMSWHAGDREAENALNLECPRDIAEDEQGGALILGRRQPGEAFTEP